MSERQPLLALRLTRSVHSLRTILLVAASRMVGPVRKNPNRTSAFAQPSLKLWPTSKATADRTGRRLNLLRPPQPPPLFRGPWTFRDDFQSFFCGLRNENHFNNSFASAMIFATSARLMGSSGRNRLRGVPSVAVSPETKPEYAASPIAGL